MHHTITGISISGKMCTGKDLLAAYYSSILPLLLTDKVGKQVAFADKLKTLTDRTNIPLFIHDCYELGYSENDVKSIEKEIYSCHDKYPLIPGRKPREFLQDLGVQLRSINPNIWIEHLELQLFKEDDQNTIYIISDCRFKNEIEFANKHNLIKVLLCTDELIRHERVVAFRGADQATQEIYNHISEKDLDNLPHHTFDIHIDNSSSLVNLFNNSKIELLKSSFLQDIIVKPVRDAFRVLRGSHIGFLGC